MGKMVGVSLMTLCMCSWVKLDKSCVFCFLFERMLGPFLWMVFRIWEFWCKKACSQNNQKNGCSSSSRWGTDVLSHGRSIRGISLPGPYPTLPNLTQDHSEIMGWMNNDYGIQLGWTMTRGSNFSPQICVPMTECIYPNPGDSKWPFDPQTLEVAFTTFPKGHVFTIP